MKYFFSLITGLMISFTITAQVYSFTPKYHFSGGFGDPKGKNRNLGHIDTSYNDEFIADLDHNTLKTQVELLPITGVTKDETNHLITIKVPRTKKINVWCFYELLLDDHDVPVLIQEAQEYTGSYSDTFFDSYTNNPVYLSFAMTATLAKSNITPDANKGAETFLARSLYDKPYTGEKNRFELRNGMLTWTEGSDITAVVHHISITDGIVNKQDGTEAITIYGTDEAGYTYTIDYGDTNKAIDPEMVKYNETKTLLGMFQYKGDSITMAAFFKEF